MAQTNNLYDVVVIGGGPAGLTAGLYLARARYRVLILEKDDFGGQITITNEVVNYPGVGRTTGRALTQTMRQQAQDFGAEFLSAEATGLDVDGDIKTVHTSRGDLKAFGILIATGASPRKLGFEGEAEYAGRGVAYCATCDGEFFTRKEVLVVGGGFAAAEESVFLTKYASKVTVLVREPDFTCDAAVAAEAKNNPKIDVRYNVELKGVTAGQGGLREATILDRTTGETEAWKPADDGTFGVFVFAGYVPATQLVRGVVELDDHGYVVTHDYLETLRTGRVRGRRPARQEPASGGHRHRRRRNRGRRAGAVRQVHEREDRPGAAAPHRLRIRAGRSLGRRVRCCSGPRHLAGPRARQAQC